MLQAARNSSLHPLQGPSTMHIVQRSDCKCPPNSRCACLSCGLHALMHCVAVPRAAGSEGGLCAMRWRRRSANVQWEAIHLGPLHETYKSLQHTKPTSSPGTRLSPFCNKYLQVAPKINRVGNAAEERIQLNGTPMGRAVSVGVLSPRNPPFAFFAMFLFMCHKLVETRPLGKMRRKAVQMPPK